MAGILKWQMHAYMHACILEWVVFIGVSVQEISRERGG